MYKLLLFINLSPFDFISEIEDSVGLAQVQVNAAGCYTVMGIYDRAIKLAMSSEKYMRADSGHLKELAVLYNLLGNIHTKNANYSMAMEYYNKSLEIRTTKGKELGISIAATINNLGEYYFELEKLDSALMFFKQHKDLAEEMGSKKNLAKSYLNMAQVYIKTGESQTAIDLLNKSEALCAELSYKRGELFVYLMKADYYIKNNLNSAQVEAQRAFDLASSLGLNREKLRALKTLEEIMGAKKSYAQAYEYSQKYSKLRDEVEGKEQLSKIYSYEISSQLDQKNVELINLKRKREVSELKRKQSVNERNFFIVIFVLVFLLALLLLYRYNQKKRFVEEYFASDTGVIMKTGKKILFEDIHRVETIRNDLIVFMSQGKITEKSTTLKAFSVNLPKIQFGRPQRGIIVNFNHIDKVLKTKIEFRGETINISPKYKEEFLEQWESFLATRKA